MRISDWSSDVCSSDLKWFWRGMRMLALVGTMMDYMLSKRVMSWKEAWEIYGVENGGALFRDLARYGIRPPKGWDLASEVSEHGTHQFMLALYQWSFGTAFHAWIPNEQDKIGRASCRERVCQSV